MSHSSLTLFPFKWLPLLTSSDDVDKTFQGMQERGVKVVRTWVQSLFDAVMYSWLIDALGIQCNQWLRIGRSVEIWAYLLSGEMGMEESVLVHIQWR